MQNLIFYPLAGPVLVILALSILFVLVGRHLSAHLQARTVSSSPKPEDALGLALSYGAGLVAFLTVWILFDFFLKNARLSLYVACGIMIATVLVARWRGWAAIRIKLGTTLSLLVLFSFFTTYDLSKGLWLTWESMPKDLSTVGVWDGTGVVVHSFRANNIALFIHDRNYIPVLPQHIGQSLLAVVPSFAGFHSPLYSLLIWHAAIVSFFVLSIYATIRAFTQSVILATLGTAVASFGNMTFSKELVVAADIGSIPAVIMSIDGAIGLATLLLFIVVVLQRTLAGAGSEKPVLDRVLIFTLVVGWCVCATQNLFMAPPILAAGLFMRALHTRQAIEVLPHRRLQFISFAGVFMLAAIAGSLRGGMLVPVQFHERSSIPGVIQVKIEGKKPIAFHSPEVISDSSGRRNPAPSSLQANAPPSIGMSAINFARSCYYILFPIAGLVLFCTTVLRGTVSTFDRAFLLAASGLFLFGLFVQSSMEMYGRSWELSRFFYPGLLLAMITLSLGVIRASTWFAPRSDVVAGLLALPVVALICATPLSLILQHYWRVFLQPLWHGNLDWHKPLEFVLTLTQIVGKN